MGLFGWYVFFEDYLEVFVDIRVFYLKLLVVGRSIFEEYDVCVERC